MSDALENSSLSKKMRTDWDTRVTHDYRYWMSDGVSSDEEMWQTGFRDLEILLDEVDDNAISQSVVLEIGCGVGRIVNAASTKASYVLGVDVSQKAIEIAESLKNKENIQFILGNGVDLREIPNNSVDIGISFASLGSMPADIFANYIIELSRVIKTNGTLRIQVYLGKEQNIPAEDTLALRAYNYDRLEKALSQTGFLLNYLKEVKLPFEVSDFENGVVAFIIGAEKISDCEITKERFLEILLEESEKTAGAEWKGSKPAHLVALARAKQCIDVCDFIEAKKALEVARQEYSDETAEFKLIQELLVKSEKEYLATSQIGSMHRSHFGIISSAEGEVLEYKGITLSHKTSPLKAANAWVERTLKTLKNGPKCILLVGAGDAHFANALAKANSSKTYVYETNTDILEVTRERLTPEIILLEKFDDIKNLDTNNFEVAYLPALPFYNKEIIDEVKIHFNAKKFDQTLSPKLAIVGPFMGGTLPIANYIKRALFQLDKEAHFIDLSQFSSTFTGFSSLLNKKSRQSEIENSFVELVSNLVLQIVEEKGIDILVSVAQAPLSPKVLEKLREKGVVTVHWFMEDTRRFHTWKQIAPYYDYFYLIQKDESISEVLGSGGRRVRYLPLGCDPTIHVPMTVSQAEKNEFGSLVSFVGAGYNNRRHVFSKMSDLDFKLWGTEWPNGTPFDRMVQRQGARISVDDYIKIFNSSKINMNLHSSQERDGVDPSGDFVNPRVFELASCGAFQLTDNRTLLPELFDIKTEMATFSHENEIRDLIDYYATHDDERIELAFNARKRALKDHTYKVRLQDMLTQIYAEFGDHLQKRSDGGVWQRTLQKSKNHPELYELLEKVKYNREEPTLDNLVKPFIDGNTVLTEVEQKLLFMNHMRGQITQIQRLRQE